MNILLLLFSLILYCSYGYTGLIFIVLSTLITFITTKNFNKKCGKLLYYLNLIINIGLLIFFKIVGFNNFFGLIDIGIPLGISYYTFEIISYTVDVYKKKYDCEKNLFNFFLYVMYFPYLLMGPINRYDDIKETLFKKRKFTSDNFINGSLRIVLGLFKKFVIASRIAIVVNMIVNKDYSGSYVLLCLLLYSFNIYCDFSGGIDIVIGISKILGIDLKENFNTPYLSQSFREFWKRWHITLGSFLRDYVYIPLGGSHCSRFRCFINTLITFIVSGLWHGINYFFWGIINGVLVFFSPKETKHKYLSMFITFIMITLLWIFFVYNDANTILNKFISIFTVFNYKDLFNNILNLGLNKIEWITLLISIILLIIYEFNFDKINSKIINLKFENKLFIILTIIIIVLLLGVYGFGFDVNQFIYSKF